MAGILRVAFAALLIGAAAMAPAPAGVPVLPVLPPDAPAPAEESTADPFDRSPRSESARRTPPPGVRPPLPTGPATPPAFGSARTPAGPFYLSVPPHVRFCVWRE